MLWLTKSKFLSLIPPIPSLSLLSLPSIPHNNSDLEVLFMLWLTKSKFLSLLIIRIWRFYLCFG